VRNTKEYNRQYERTSKRKAYKKNYRKKYGVEHPEKMREKWRKRHQRRKEKIIKLLGGKCVICGYSGPALQIDHINNDGAEERKKHGNSNGYYSIIYKKIKEGSKDYQLLCANCNWEKILAKKPSPQGTEAIKEIKK